MKWEMPKIKGKKRWKVEPCIISPEDRSIEEVAVAIAIVAVRKAETGGLGAPAQLFAVLKDIEEIPPEAEEALYKELRETDGISIDYWQGKCVKLNLKIIESQIHISLNLWMDRVDDYGSQTIPQKAIDELQEVLKEAQGLLETKQERLGEVEPGRRPLERVKRLESSVQALEEVGIDRKKTTSTP